MPSFEGVRAEGLTPMVRSLGSDQRFRQQFPCQLGVTEIFALTPSRGKPGNLVEQVEELATVFLYAGMFSAEQVEYFYQTGATGVVVEAAIGAHDG